MVRFIVDVYVASGTMHQLLLFSFSSFELAFYKAIEKDSEVRAMCANPTKCMLNVSQAA